MTENPFHRLAPFIQEYIYKVKWNELRAIQVQASAAIFDTPGHVLITSGTASGKTEAAFLPIVTELYNKPSSTIGILYIGPLKALLNDQFQRLHSLLEESRIPVQSWHGDVPQSKRQTFLKSAQGVLQITPESLEAMLMRRSADLTRLFGDLRFVVIDEVHAFIASDRGRQVICQLQRLARYQHDPTIPTRRIGLSATLGTPEQAMQWLAGGTTLPVTLVGDTLNRRDVLLALEHYDDPPLDYDKMLRKAESAGDVEQIATLYPLTQDIEKMYAKLFEMTQRERKTLVFANSRREVEQTTYALRRLAEQHHIPDIYHAHHGNIAAPLRQAAETAMQTPDYPACVVATITLELGIDLGQLDQVLQLNEPPSVVSFVQRLGRSGRRGNPAKMFFFNHEVLPTATTPLGKQIPWALLQTIAIIQLYVEEKWLEPPVMPTLPLSLLYHQTMSCVAASTELSPAELAAQVLTLAPFAQVTQDQYRDLLQHLLKIKHLEHTETGGLIIGLQGEKLINDYHFFATFRDEVAYLVRDSTSEIGSIQQLPAVGDRLALAGRTWKVLQIDKKQQNIFVEPVAGGVVPSWSGGMGEHHERVVQRIRQVLLEDQNYGYLQPQAIQRLNGARHAARPRSMTRAVILPLGGNRYLVLPWQGTRVVDTLIRLLQYEGLQVNSSGAPFYFEITLPDSSTDNLRRRFQQLAAQPPTATDLIAQRSRESLQRDKYDPFVPENLLRQASAIDTLDLNGAVAALKAISASESPALVPEK